MPTILDSINHTTPEPMTPRERELVNHLRVLLKDVPEDVFRSLGTLTEEKRGQRWNDTQLLVYLNSAVADINAEPPFSYFGLPDFPESLRQLVLTGAMIFALIAEGVLQSGEQFSYSDNGLSLNINLAQSYQSMAQMLLSGYIQQRQTAKKAFRPLAAGVRSSPMPQRIRTYAPRMWTYR